ncbi:PepSY domain-containing protein [Pontibacterium sp.]|uniref:PepSY domain-containing protein n=1 Tax=Pontibacterium sp. TaxID=2036026 RepID=UPI003519A1B6
MKKALVLATALFSTTLFSGPLLAHDSNSTAHPKHTDIVVEQSEQLLSISEALRIASEIAPATYNNIELLPGKADHVYYLIEGLDNGQERFVILNAKTGTDVTQRLTQPQSSLSDAVSTVERRCAGKVVEASLDFEPDYEAVYSVIVENDDSYLHVMLDSDSLKVIAVETLEEEMDDESLAAIEYSDYSESADY